MGAEEPGMSISEQKREAFDVGHWHVKPALNRISQGAQTHEVEPKVMQVLVCLAQHPGEVVSREDLLETVWAGTYVTNVTLTRCISELRKILGDDPQTPQYIETIRKTGYRLIATVVRAPTSKAPIQVETVSVVRTPSWVWGVGFGGVVAVLILGIVQWRENGGHTSITHLEPVLPFTSLPGTERYPVVVPHGDQVVFAWDGGDGMQTDLYLKQVNSADLVRLTNHPGTEAWPTWRSDSKELAFVRYDETGCHLVVINALGNGERTLGTCRGSRMEGMTWSPSSEWLVYATQPASHVPFQLIAFSTRTQTDTVLTSPPSTAIGDVYPAFRDNETLAFVRSQAIDNDDVFLLDWETKATRQATQTHRPIRGLTWTQGRERIVFASNKDGPYGLWQVAWGGGLSTRLGVAQAENLRLPHIPRLSYGLTMERVVEDTNLLLVGEETAPMAVSTEMERDPAVAPLGDAVAFVSTRSGSPQVWTYHRTRQTLQQITQFENALVYTPQWSPDGKQLAFVAREGAQAQVYLVTLEQSSVQALSSTRHNAYHPQWSPDGQFVYWASSHTGTWQVWRADVAGGEAMQVTLQGGYYAAPHLDGRTLYVTKYRDRALWRLDLETGNEHLVEPAFLQHPDQQWRYQSGYIYRLDPTSRALIASPVDALDNNETPFPMPEQPVLDYAVAPQNAFVVYTVQNRNERDVWFHRTFYND